MRLQLTLALLVVPSIAHAQDDWRVSADALCYTDTDNVTAVTPALSVRRRIDGGGSAGVRIVADVVSAASVDVISQATVRFEEVRTEGGLDLALPVGGVLPSVAYRFSYEPDYLSNGVTLGLRTRLGTPDSTLPDAGAVRHLAWMFLAVGCALPNEPALVPELDAVFYRAEVAPVVGPSCASLECHGVESRPLRIYAEDGLRRRDEDRGQPLTMAEAAWNAATFAGVDPEPSPLRTHVALTKPLSIDAGGIEHVADDVWLTLDDPAYECLRGWLVAEVPLAACAAARE